MAITEIEKLGGKLTVGGSGIGPGMDVFSVDLSSSKVADAGLVHLKKFAQLQSLDLTQTQVTDAGLEHLNGLAQLQSLNLRGTGVTDAGVEKLQQALPNCKVARNAPDTCPDAGGKWCHSNCATTTSRCDCTATASRARRRFRGN